MGINGLWDVIGEGSLESIAALSTEHFNRTGRPFRIAIDEAGWRFHNLDDFKIAQIREKEPRANPKEKAIFHRVISLLQLHVELLFVFDGPRRPWKRGRPAGGIKYERVALLRETLDALKVPHHRAPGEAEAECAKLQREGIVDAVWSEDGDTLMFGADCLLRTYRERDRNDAKSKTHVRVHRAAELRQRLGLDQHGLILFAILSGGDYCKGIHGCGPQVALRAAQRGLGQQLCRAWDSHALDVWRAQLQEFFPARGRVQLIVPPEFPGPIALKNYRTPVVSTSDELSRFFEKPTHQWGRPFDEDKLSLLAAEKFNVTGALYFKHIDPIVFVRCMANTNLHEREGNRSWNVRLIKARRNADSETTNPHTTRVKISPRNAQTFTVADDSQPIECTMLSFLLQRGLPEDVLCAVPSKRANKRKADRENAPPIVVFGADSRQKTSLSDGSAYPKDLFTNVLPEQSAETHKRKRQRTAARAHTQTPCSPKQDLTASLFEGMPVTKYSGKHLRRTPAARVPRNQKRTSWRPAETEQSASPAQAFDFRMPTESGQPSSTVASQSAAVASIDTRDGEDDEDNDLPNLDSLLGRNSHCHRTPSRGISQPLPSTAASNPSPESESPSMPTEIKHRLQEIDEWNDAQLTAGLAASLHESYYSAQAPPLLTQKDMDVGSSTDDAELKAAIEASLRDAKDNKLCTPRNLGVIDLCGD